MDRAKHRHHFVPRKYLRQWCVGDEENNDCRRIGTIMARHEMRCLGLNEFFVVECVETVCVCCECIGWCWHRRRRNGAWAGVETS